MALEPRFTVCSGKKIDVHDTLLIHDGVKNDYLDLICFNPAEAQLITNHLNTELNPRWRQLLALEVADFRMFLEHENGVPLNEEPYIAMLLDNLCAFLHFNTGERALALGPDLLVLLNRFEDHPTSAIQIIEMPPLAQPSPGEPDQLLAVSAPLLVGSDSPRGG